MDYKITIVLILSSILLANCNPGIFEVTQSSNKAPSGELNLQMGYEVYELRIDLIRNITSEKGAVVLGDATTVQASSNNVPYHYLGMYLYDGVFLDLNFNLSFNIDHFYKNFDKNDFAIKKKRSIKSKASYDVTKTGKNAKCTSKGLVGKNSLYIDLSDSLVTIKPSRFSPKQNIHVNNRRISYQPDDIKNTPRTEIIRVTNGYIVLNADQQLGVSQPDQNTIRFENMLIVKNHGDKVEFIYPGLNGGSAVYTMVKLKDGYVFYNEDNHGVRIKKIGNRIFVEKNGQMTCYYESDYAMKN